MFSAIECPAYAVSRCKSQMLPYVGSLMQNYGYWHWGYAYSIEQIIDFGKNELPTPENPQEAKMMQKTLRYLEKHPKQYDYFPLNRGVAFVAGRHLFTTTIGYTDPQYFYDIVRSNPLAFDDYFRNIQNVVMKEGERVLVDASMTFNAMVVQMRYELIQLYPMSELVWLAIEYNSETKQYINVCNNEELRVTEETKGIYMKYIQKCKEQYPEATIFRFRMHMPIEATTGIWYKDYSIMDL